MRRKSSDQVKLTTRSSARSVSCPWCGVIAGLPCVGKRGKVRESAHAERHEAAIRAGHPVLAGRS